MDIIKFLSGQPEGEITSEEKAVLSKLRIMAKNDPQHELWHFVQAPEQLALSMLEKEYSGPIVWKEDYPKYPVLHYAVSHQKFKIVSFLLQKGAPPIVKDESGRTILHISLERAIAIGPNKITDFKNLLVLLFHKEKSIFSDLSLRHYNINDFKDADGNTILHSLMRSSWGIEVTEIQKIIELLLPYNPDFNATNNIGDTPLHTLAACDETASLKRNLEKNENYQVKVAEILLNHKTEAHKENNFGITALEIAEVFGRGDLSEALRKAPRSFLHTLNPIHKKATTEKALLTLLNDCFPEDRNGENPYLRLKLRKLIIAKPQCILHHMIRQKVDINTIKSVLETYTELLEKGKCLNHEDNKATDMRNQTPLLTAILQPYFDVIPFLLNHGANINYQDNYGQCALHLLAEGSFIGEEAQAAAVIIFKHILKHDKVKPNLQDKEGNTPLHTLIIYGINNLEHDNLIMSMVDALLQHEEIDVNISNKEYNTPLEELIIKGRDPSIPGKTKKIIHELEKKIRDVYHTRKKTKLSYPFGKK